MTVFAKYDSSDLIIQFSAELEKSDYGVPGSPIFWEVNPDSVEILTIEILGKEYKLEDLPESLQTSLYELADEVEFI